MTSLRGSRLLLLMSCLGGAGWSVGCGDDTSSPADDGGADEAATEDSGPDADADADGEAGDGPATFEFDFYVFEWADRAADLLGPPIEGVAVAVDLPAGREDLLTGADGSVHVSMPADVPDVTITAAKVGWLPVTTIYRATITEIEERIATDGRLYAVLSPHRPPSTEATRITATSTGATSFCAAVYFWNQCTNTGVWDHTITWDDPTPRPEPWDLVAYSVDADQCPVELFETTFPDLLTDRSVEIPFDGSGSAPEQVDITIQLPDDPESWLRTRGLHTDWGYPVFALHDGASHSVIRGVSCAEEVSADGASVTASVRWFPPASGELTFGLIASLSGGTWADDAFSYQILPGPPTAGTYQVLDIPDHFTMPPAVTARLTTTFEPPEVPGTTTFDLIVVNGTDRWEQLWVARSLRSQSITLPALPSAYDRSVDWPDHNRAAYRARVCAAPLATPQFWPQPLGTNCGNSALLPGAFE